MMTFATRPLVPFGVEIVDVDLRGEIAPGRFAALRRLVVEEGLVLARGQAMSAQEHCRLGERFGSLESLSLERDRRASGVLVVSNLGDDGRTLGPRDRRMRTLAANELWHTDSSFRDRPASFSLLSAVVVPDQGGDTLFASLRRGWDTLDPGLRAGLHGLRAVHDYTAMGFPPVAHPIVRVHPESRRVGLYLSEHARAVEGWPEDRGRALIDRLLSRCTRPSEVYRHSWRVGDLLLWDNRSMLHRAQGFEADHPRVMHHVRVAGTEGVIPAPPS